MVTTLMTGKMCPVVSVAYDNTTYRPLPYLLAPCSARQAQHVITAPAGKSFFRWKSSRAIAQSALPWENSAMNGIAEDSLSGQ